MRSTINPPILRTLKSKIENSNNLNTSLLLLLYLKEYVNDKVVDWVNEDKRLAEFAVSQPQACFAAFTFGLKHHWTYFLRTLPDIDTLLEPLERALAEVLIPSSLSVITPQQNGISYSYHCGWVEWGF